MALKQMARCHMLEEVYVFVPLQNTFLAFHTQHLMCSRQDIFVFQKKHFVCSKHDISCVPSKTFPVFHAGRSVYSKQDVPCAPRATLRVFHTIISSYHHVITSSYHHIIIRSYDHTIILANQKNASQFWPKVKKKIEIDLFTPPPKIVES